MAARAEVVVDDLQVAAYTVPTEAPEADGTLTWNETTAIVVRVRAGDRCGLGYTYGSPACTNVIRVHLADVVRGLDAMDVPAAWSAMVAAVRNIGRPGLVSMAIAAVDTALWDLKARLLDVPLGRLLGLVRTDVPVYGSGGFTSMSERDLVEQLGGWVEAGIPRVKMKVGTAWGREPRRDIARATAVRAALGDGPELFVDANGAYSAKQAARLGRRYEELGVTWFEEPVSSDHLSHWPICGVCSSPTSRPANTAMTSAYFADMCQARAVDVVQADVTRCGGITEWLRIAAVAAAHGLQISGHCAPITARARGLRALRTWHTSNTSPTTCASSASCSTVRSIPSPERSSCISIDRVRELT